MVILTEMALLLTPKIKRAVTQDFKRQLTGAALELQNRVFASSYLWLAQSFASPSPYRVGQKKQHNFNGNTSISSTPLVGFDFQRFACADLSPLFPDSTTRADIGHGKRF